jgi:hypothetical protein
MYQEKAQKWANRKGKEMASVTAQAVRPLQVVRTTPTSVINPQVNVHYIHQKPAKQPIRLTRRGRRVVALLVLIPVVVAFWLIGAKVAQASDSAATPSTATVVVKPGQSLWDVATAAGLDRDPRETIWMIQQLNGMQTSEVLAGQELIVPTR